MRTKIWFDWRKKSSKQALKHAQMNECITSSERMNNTEWMQNKIGCPKSNETVQAYQSINFRHNCIFFLLGESKYFVGHQWKKIGKLLVAKIPPFESFLSFPFILLCGWSGVEWDGLEDLSPFFLFFPRLSAALQYGPANKRQTPANSER